VQPRIGRNRRLPLLPGLGILVFHTLAITSAGFRLPIEAFLLLPAAVVFTALGEYLGSFIWTDRRSRSLNDGAMPDPH
jgi:hypothetical protein